jgi:protein-tyrosine phosphatase
MPPQSISVCFVCLGNICRSPMAEGIMKALVAEAGLDHRIHVESAGTGAWHLREPADRRARAAARARGVTLKGTAKQFRSEDFRRFDYIIAMDDTILSTLKWMAHGSEAAKLHAFRAFDPTSPAGATVPDPYYGAAEEFNEVFDICEAGCRGLLARMRAELEPVNAAGARQGG